MINRQLHSLLKIKSKFVDKNAIFSIFNIPILSLLIKSFLLILFLFSVSCNQFKVSKEEVIARVGSVYLYRTDLEKELDLFINKDDSILKTRNFIDQWARNQIILQQAKINLNLEEIESLDALIDQYKIDLYSNTYKQTVLNKSIDTIISVQELDSFLIQNQSIFKLNSPLYQVRYIQLPHDNVDVNEIKRSFQRFNTEDVYFLDSLSFQFTNHILVDSVWINKSNLLSEISFLNQENLNKYIKKSQFFEIEDSLGVYLFFVKNHLMKGDIPPNEVLSPTIKNIILNQRKLKFNKQFEKDILHDAIKSKTYEIY
ncbi:peptidyl-prolyl cis-trans isomerase [Flavobacteriaceae bacterium]|nr:peptidyl-prolyl cis-trans isomerase [Flavobacteriaceae bacterium]MDC1543568.1 peptidyl-prolyl cis-trans isomerase [Flavobacteriaceae bacterium]